MLNIEIDEDGNLVVTADEDGVDYINTHKGERHHAVIWCDLIESHSCNGSYTYCNADDLGMMSEAPCIVQEMYYADDGTREPIGHVWFFAEYMIVDELDLLVNGFPVKFRKL